MITFLTSLVHHMEPNRIVPVIYKRIKKKKKYIELKHVAVTLMYENFSYIMLHHTCNYLNDCNQSRDMKR